MKLVVAIAMMFVSFNASADYFKAGLGYAVGGKVKASGAGSGEADLDTGVPSPLLLAYGFEMMGDVHGELEFSYRSNEYDVPGATAEPTFINGAFNVVGNAPMGGVTLTGGAGFTFGSFDPDNATDAGTALGVQLFGGVDFPINETVSLGGEFRYLTTITKIDAGSGIDYSYDNASVLFNIKFGM